MRYQLAKSVAICAAAMSLCSQDAWALETVEEPEFETVKNFADQTEEVNGVSQQYGTMDFIIFQTFFDKLSSNFIPGILNGLTNVTLANSTDNHFSILDGDLSFNFDLNSTHVASASIDPDTPLATINNGSTKFAIKNLNLNVTTDYGFVSDPPIFADLGEGSINIEDLSMSVVVSSTIEPFQVQLTDLEFDAQPHPFSDFNGISDFSNVVTNVVNTVVAVVRNRVESFIDGGNDMYHVQDKVEAIINKVLGLVDFPIHLGDSGLYIDGVFYSDIIQQNSQMVLPLDLMLRYDNSTFDSSVCSFKQMHAIYKSDQFDFQLALQNCAVNELLFTLYNAGVKLPLSLSAINTSKLRLLVGKDIITQFGADQPCKIIVYPTELPKIQKQFVSYEAYSPDNYWILDTTLALDIQCQRVNETDFEQATTLLLDVSSNFNANITYGVTVGLEMYTLDVDYKGDIDSTIDLQSTFLIKQEINILVGVIEGAVEAFFDHGHSFGNILLNTPLSWLDIKKIMALPNYAEPFLWAGFSPEFAPELCTNSEPFAADNLEQLMHPQTMVEQIAHNLLNDVSQYIDDWVKKLFAAERIEEDEAEQVEEFIKEVIFDQTP